MRNFIIVLGFALAPVPALFAQPTIYYRGVINAASSAPAGVPSGSIAQGSLFAVYGAAIGPAQGVQAFSFPLAATLANVSVSVTQGSNTVAALPVYVSAGQIDALMPSNAPLGMVSLKVTYNGTVSNPAPVNVISSSLGLFSVSGTGSGPGAIQNALPGGNVQTNAPAATVAPGGTIVVYGTGLGPITAPDNIAPPSGNLPVAVEAWIGGQSATVVYSGRSPCCSGLDEIVLQIPDNAPLGCWVPVYVRTAHSILSNAVTVAVAPNGQNCSEPDNSLAAQFLAGGNIGILRLLRSDTLMDLGIRATVDSVNDFFEFEFDQMTGGPFVFSPMFGQPPEGSCTVFFSPGDALGNEGIPAAPSIARRLNAGASFQLSGSGSNSTLKPLTGDRGVALGSFAPVAPAFTNKLTLNPGSYTISGGGTDVGSFSANITMPPALTWTGRSNLVDVDRTQPLALAWSGVPTGQVVTILGFSMDRPSNSSGVFYCTVPKNATGFTIPPEVLGSLPATQANILKSKGAIYVMTATAANGVPFQASGLNAAIAIGGYMIGKTVRFQ